MNQVPDRKKLRREYLRQKGNAYLSGTICALMFIPAALISLGFWVVAVAILLFGVISVIRNPASVFQMGLLFVTMILSIVIAGSSTLFTYAMWIGIEGAKQVGDIDYVPPVTPDTLPADEILVRGSEEPPVVLSEVLLRAAQWQEAPQEELLRIAGGE